MRRRRSVMRHFLRRALAITTLAGGVPMPAAQAALVAMPRGAQGLLAPQRPAVRPAGDLPPVATGAQAHERRAARAVEAADRDFDDGPRRRSPRRPDRSGRHSRCGPHCAPARCGLDGRGPGALASECLGLSNSDGAALLPHSEPNLRAPSPPRACGWAAAGDLRASSTASDLARAFAHDRGAGTPGDTPAPPFMNEPRATRSGQEAPGLESRNPSRSSPGSMAIRRGVHRNRARFQSHQQPRAIAST